MNEGRDESYITVIFVPHEIPLVYACCIFHLIVGLSTNTDMKAPPTSQAPHLRRSRTWQQRPAREGMGVSYQIYIYLLYIYILYSII